MLRTLPVTPSRRDGLRAGRHRITPWTCTKASSANGKTPKAARPFVRGLLDLAYVCGEAGRTKLYHLTGKHLRRFLQEQAGDDSPNWERAIQIDFGPRKPSLK